MKYLLFVLFLSFIFKTDAQNYKLTGFITDKETAEPIKDAFIYDKISKTGTYSNTNGFYSLTIKGNEAEIQISYIGYNSYTEKLHLEKNFQKNIKLTLETLDEVKIIAGRNSVAKNNTGYFNLNIKEIKKMPISGFQSDIIKSIQTLPGINSGTEAMSAVIVRGGSTDQNLVVIDGIPIYHYNHLDGLVSSFSTQTISNVKIYKSGFPVKYENRLSSVFDISLKNGDMKKYHAGINFGLLTSGFFAEGPVIKNKSSFIVSFRGFTLKPAIKLFPYASRNKFFYGYGFNDLYVKLNTKAGTKNRLFFTFYSGKDKKTNNELFTSGKNIRKWGNILGAVRWNKNWNSGLYGNLILYFSDYKNTFKRLTDNNKNNTENISESKNRITDIGLNLNFEYQFLNTLQIRFGLFAGHKNFEPAIISSVNYETEKKYIPIIYKQNLAAVYLSSNFTLNKYISFYTGVRLNCIFLKNQISFQSDPSVVLSFNINDKNSIKSSFNSVHQNFHALSVSNLGIKNVFYIPASEISVPQKSLQYSLGYYHSELENFNFSVELYYKQLFHLTELKELTLLSDIKTSWEEKTETNGTGKSAGIEFFADKQFKNLNFGISYTLSKTTRKFNNINNGFEYIYDFDRTHDISLYINEKINKKWTVNVSWFYLTGKPVTFATQNVPDITIFPTAGGEGKFSAPASRNNVRMADYNRLDISFKRKIIKTKIIKTTRILQLGLYNAYNRKNPYYYYWDTQTLNNIPKKPELKKICLFPLIPFISYEIKF